MEGDGIEVAKMVEVESKNFDRDDVSHLALDIGGSLIKMVYFSSSSGCSSDDQENSYLKDGLDAPNGTSNPRGLRGRLNFLKFETSKISECIKFISSKQLQHCGTLFYDGPPIKTCYVKLIDCRMTVWVGRPHVVFIFLVGVCL